MNTSMLLTVFVTIFIAELGDKTQLATLLFATDREVDRMTIFIGASLALIATSAIGVLAGAALSHLIDERVLNLLAGAAFIVIGVWTMLQASA
ncbi:MAG: TMEM165/GDT1 family protein [Gammaproteobacteria bacterium]|nr:MAG: TMEM165/GDT1 family protein [Gammaproteobacteria bacterium]